MERKNRESYLCKARYLLDGYVDEIPDFDLNSEMRFGRDSRSPKYKCRRVWFNLVGELVSHLARKEDYFVQKHFDFLEFAREFNEKRSTEESDIDYGNKILEDVIDYLECNS